MGVIDTVFLFKIFIISFLSIEFVDFFYVYRAISIRYPELPNVRSLMTRVNLPLPRVLVGSSSTTDSSGTTGTDTSELKPLPHRPLSPVQLIEVTTILGRLRRADTTDGSSILHQNYLKMNDFRKVYFRSGIGFERFG